MNLIILICGVVLIVLGIGIKIAISADSIEKTSNKSLLLIPLGLLVIILSRSFCIVETGYVGIRTTFGQISENAATQGFNWKTPFVQSIEKVNIKQQDITIANNDTVIDAAAQGKIPIKVSDVRVTYQVNSEKASWLYANVTDPSDLINYNIVSSAIKDTTINFDTDGVTVRSQVEALAKETLQKYTDDKYGENTVTVLQVVLGSISFEDEYNASVNQKNMAKQEAEKQAIENQTKIDKANADAEAKLIEAQAEKDANALIEQSISDSILRQQFIAKWDGKMPYVVGEGTSFYDLTDIINQSND